MYEWRRSRIARAVLNYLRRNPEAQDTIEGIAEWWLADQFLRLHPSTLKGALNELVARGFILQRKGKDSQIHYRVNRPRFR
jgi:DNA-binding MarR family transcriptional regulator